MTPFSRVTDLDAERVLFAVGGVLCGALTALVVVGGGDPVRAVLFGSFTLYLLGAAVPQVHERVPEYKRTAAIALGGVGALAALTGTSSLLPLLFVMGGVAALLGLW
ncbi:hypothetical protein EGH21_10030 [Halomicroarcula sp. F13]|uniref:FUSC family protein n=1 Tax=Haloarcula rubra TaxID=2487747 RepID=A0AAW4PQ63_9EURY|nr:hypothetical protein [Halomicroarcula rubra]MBX0323366.1 hypothetical protein [Halomicroarcula rubra]